MEIKATMQEMQEMVECALDFGMTLPEELREVKQVYSQRQNLLTDKKSMNNAIKIVSSLNQKVYHKIHWV